MRKWMQDKLRRRKKAKEGAAAAPAPLQPAYFEAEPPSATQAENIAEEFQPAQTEPERNVVSEGQSIDQRESTAAGMGTASADTQTATDPNRGPRRRRRGGRGRRRSGQPASPQVVAAPAAPAPQPPPPLSATAHRAKGVVILAIGLPGSGKSSWFKRHNITPLSSDLMRSLLFDDPTEQGFQDLVFSNLRSMLKARLLARRPLNYVDATNLTPHERHAWIKLAKDYGYEVQAVFFDVPLEVCLERNHRRQRVVSDDVMRQMAAKLKPPAFEEGFSKITVVRVKQQASA
jgi:predicted kinase